MKMIIKTKELLDYCNNDINSDSNSINSASTGINDMKKSENIESSKVNNDISLNNEFVNIYDNRTLNTKKKKKKKFKY